jgi:DNA-binding MarR family transcriptional regulator
MAFVNGGGLILGGGMRRDRAMAELDDIIHRPIRLKIMAALNAMPAGSGLEFSRLKQLTAATDGNLGAHIATLARAGYVAVAKAFVARKPRTTVTATSAGRGAFARHVAALQDIIPATPRQQ